MGKILKYLSAEELMERWQVDSVDEVAYAVVHGLPYEACKGKNVEGQKKYIRKLYIESTRPPRHGGSSEPYNPNNPERYYHPERWQWQEREIIEGGSDPYLVKYFQDTRFILAEVEKYEKDNGITLKNSDQGPPPKTAEQLEKAIKATVFAMQYCGENYRKTGKPTKKAELLAALQKEKLDPAEHVWREIRRALPEKYKQGHGRPRKTKKA